MGEYVQSVPPGRRNIYPAAIAQLGKAAKLKGNISLIDNSLTQLLLDGAKIGLKLPGVQYDAKSRMMEIYHVSFTSDGEDIGSYSIRESATADTRLETMGILAKHYGLAEQRAFYAILFTTGKFLH